MNLGAIILCRHDSSRLPGKILKQIKGKPMLQYIVERMQTSQRLRQVVVATSQEASDDPIAEYCARHGLACFRGDKNNVAQRFLDCGIAYEFEFCVRINGDNLFTDAAVLDEMVSSIPLSEYDFISNVQGRTFPYGMSIEIVRSTFYRQSIQQFDLREHFEHVTLYYYQHPEYGRQFHFRNQICPEAAGIKLAIDTPTDFDLAENLIGKMNSEHIHYDLPSIYALWKSVEQEK